MTTLCFDLDLTRGLVVFHLLAVAFKSSLVCTLHTWIELRIALRLVFRRHGFIHALVVRFALQSLMCSLTESAHLSCRQCTNPNLQFIMFGSVVQDFVALLKAQLCLSL